MCMYTHDQALCPALGWAGLIAVSQREWRTAERAGQERCVGGSCIYMKGLSVGVSLIWIGFTHRALLEGKMRALGLNPAAYLG